MILRDYQIAGIDGLKHAYSLGKRALLFVLATGGGKCLGRGTPVLMFDGTVRAVEDVECGDLLMGPDSFPRKVVSTCRGSESLYRITPVKGDSYIVNESHILSLRITPSKRNLTGPNGEIYGDGDTSNVSVADYLSSSKNFRHRAKGWRVGVDFTPSDLSDDLPPYILGMWLGDGSSRTCGISSMDPEIVAELDTYAAARGMYVRREIVDGKCPTYYVTRGRHCVGRGHMTNPFLRALAKHNLRNNKHIPHCYLVNSRDARLELLAGIIDTDGSLARTNYDFISKYERLADDVCFLARSLGLAAYKNPCEKTCGNNGVVGTYYRVSISGDCGIIPVRVPRKMAPVRKQKKSVLVTGITVDPIGEGEFFGFELSGPDRLFLLGDFTVTHNTVVFAYITVGASTKGKKVLIVAHRRELIKQASRKLSEAGVEHGIIAPGFTPTRDGVQVASIQTLANRLDKLGKFDLIVIDEGHHSVAGTYMKLIASQPAAKLLLVTATPERPDGRGLGIKSGGVCDDIVIGPSSGELIKDGYLTPVRVFAPPSGPDLSGVKISMGDYERTSLSKVMSAPKLVGDAVAHYAKLSPGQPAVAFCVNVQNAKDVAATFRAAGWRAVAADGTSSAEERDAALGGLVTGAVQVLCVCDLVSEGLDIPGISVVIMLRSTKSLVNFLQWIGRGLRPVYASGFDLTTVDGRIAAIAASSKPYCLVLDHAGCTLNHGMPDAAREWSLDGRPKKDKAQPTKQCKQCFAIHSPSPKCPECGFSYANEVKPQRAMETVDGELVEFDESPEIRHIRQTPLRLLLTGNETREELIKIQKAKGYAYGWVYRVLDERKNRRKTAA